jgi:hypothetical protein
VLQVTCAPVSADALTVQTPLHDWMQSHEIGDVPQVLFTHWARNAPPARTRQTWPAGHVTDDGVGQVTTVHAAEVTVHRGDDTLPATQVAIVRPAPAQSS